MCGITGFIDSRPNYSVSEVAQRMGQMIHKRGPDSCGVWRDDNLGVNLIHRRLAILDLTPTGHQPMLSSCGRFILVFNGEIYNWRKIKSDLELQCGQISWRGHSDTEVILHSFVTNGITKTLEQMEGMFAIALWDREEDSLYLIRDRIGEKPLYYGYFNGVFGFTSELKAFKPHPQFDPEINRDAIGQLVLHNCIPAPLSIFDGIKKLLPGRYLKLTYKDFLNKELPVEVPFWSLKDHVRQSYNGSENEAVDDLEKLLSSVIQDQMIADVPIGCFLSGGVDSSLIAALMQKMSSTAINTFSLGFTNSKYNEANYAKTVATHLGTKHTELYISDSDAMRIIPDLANIYDEPFSDSSQIPTYFLSKLAKSQVTVSLSGDGGDELFAGYSRYLFAENIYNKQARFPRWIKAILCKLIPVFGLRALSIINLFYKLPIVNLSDKVYKLENLLKANTFTEFYSGLTGHWLNNSELVKGIKNHKSPWLSDCAWMKGENRLMMQYLDTIGYLPDDILTKVDRAAMANSLETRVPLLNHKVVEFAFSLPEHFKIRDGVGKLPLREILYKHVPKQLIERPKQGFAIPIQDWLRGDLKDWAIDLLDPQKVSQQGYFNAQLVDEKFASHLSGKSDNGYYLWDILMFQQWLTAWKKDQ